MENEAATLDNLQLAMAAKASGGIVIVQVERIVPAGSLHSRDIKIPGQSVDYVVVAQPEDHIQTYATDYSGAFSGEFRAPPDSVRSMENLTHLHADQIGEEQRELRRGHVPHARVHQVQSAGRRQ
ncbi:hypothetical protein [Rhizobium leguminosarum]|uniref:hypothetical protein n=1 Tax=Rhizobium leguminosarum TaxID=384 RepID=UPI0039656781